MNPAIQALIALEKELMEVKERIRTDFKECAIVFIDMVDSTKYKFANDKNPENWIVTLSHFEQIVSQFIKLSNGTVIKFIGDEVMAVFKGENLVPNTISFLNQVENLEQEIFQKGGFPVQIKIAVDYGKVFYFTYEGHQEEDPQGIPIDRCARIAKLCEPGTILTSKEFASKSGDSLDWVKLSGIVNLKSFGEVEIYQLNKRTINLAKSDGNLFRLIAAGKVFDLFEMVNVKEISPNVKHQWCYDRKCLVHDYIILEKYNVSVDTYLEKLPFEIQLFGRDEDSWNYILNVMCDDNNYFLPEPSKNYAINNKRLIFASFEYGNDIRAIADRLISLLLRIEEHIKSINPN